MKLIPWMLIAWLTLLTAGGFSPLAATDDARQAYDRMVEESVREADEYVQQKQEEQRQAVKEEQSEADTALTARVQAEQERILAEMETVRNRGLGPTYTQGMKENQLQELQAQLDRLTSDPDAYFGGQ